MNIRTIEECVGNTPLVKLQRLYQGATTVLCKLEGDNPGGSVKDRPALSMIRRAEEAGRIRPGDTLIEATSGNTGIALAMVAAARGYKMVVIMPEHMSEERRAVMRAYGAEVILTSTAGSMEEAIDTARQMESEGRGVILDQFSNPDNPRAHYETTGPEIWRDTDGRITHFVASTGTTGTLMGTSHYLKEQNPDVRIVGVTPDADGGIPGIRKWPQEYQPRIFDESRLDERRQVGREEAVAMMRALAREEGIFGGISSGGNVAVALRLARELEVEGPQGRPSGGAGVAGPESAGPGSGGAVIVTIICDRGDRYLSMGLY
ncbi:MAG: cysteine synthase CysM [bacterium]